MKRTAYNYILVNSYRQIGKTIEWIRVWFKQSARKYKYRFYPFVLTFTNKLGLYKEKRFKDIDSLNQYLQIA